MPMSLAPSPTAIVSAGSSRSRAVSSSSASSFASRPRIGSATKPVKALGLEEEGVGAVLVEADGAGDRLGKDGETAGDQRRVGAGCAHRGDQDRGARHDPDALRQDFCDDRRSPGPSAWRRARCSAGSKAISPRMARSVMAATSRPTPISAASSSRHSCSIRVESMSATRSRLRRKSAGIDVDVDRPVAERRAGGGEDCVPLAIEGDFAGLVGGKPLGRTGIAAGAARARRARSTSFCGERRLRNGRDQR